MRLLIAFMLAAVLLLGCTGEEQKTPELQENASSGGNETTPPVVIVVEPQKNQSVGGEGKNETEPPEEQVPDFEQDPDAQMGIYFMNITDGEHGNAILIKKGDFDMLIDGGPAESGPLVVDFLRSYEVDDLEVVVSTNGDPRNYGGLALVGEKYEIDSFWYGGDDFDDPAYAAVIKQLEEKAGSTQMVDAGFTAEYNGISFKALNPQKTRSGDVNNDAIVLRVDERELSALLTSGIHAGAQGELINRYPSDMKVEVMQAPYYGVGSGTGAIGVFLVSAKPRYMIITGSADESPENGGDRSPFRRLMDQYGITYYENYQRGPIRVSSGPQGFTIDELGK